MPEAPVPHPAELLALAEPPAPDWGETGWGDAALRAAVASWRAGDSAAARRRIETIARLLPDWDQPLLALGDLLRMDGALADAMQAFRAVLERAPNCPPALLALAGLHLARCETGTAIALLHRCCAGAPDYAAAWDALGTTLHQRGESAEAATAFARACAIRPDDPDQLLRRVEAAVAAGQGGDILAELERRCAADPLDVTALIARAATLDALDRESEAASLAEVAVALAPGSAAAAIVQARILVRLQDAAASEAALRRALGLIAPTSPLRANLRNNHAAALMRIYRHREARELLQALIAEHGEQPGFYCNLANACVSLAEQDAGVAAACRATELAPNSHSAWRTVCNALPYQHGASAMELLAAARQAGATMPRAPALPADDRAAAPGRRLRLGLLSATLKTHPVGWLTVAAIEALDRDAFDIVCIAQPPSDDPIERRFRAAASAWHVANARDAAALARQIRELRIDILIDLGGYGDRGLIGACAFRAAPVQIKWVGMQCHSTGLAEIDWFITDRWETPPGFEPLYSERLLRLPDGYVCYSPPAYAPDVAPLPALAHGRVTFGCFNNIAKITPATIAAWAEILRAVPDARLILGSHGLADPATAAGFADAFADRGVTEDRLVFRGSVPHRALLRAYHEIDIALDPFPYTGGLTTIEALWMGVPVVTLAGEAFAARHSTSHLSNVGLSDWIARTPEDYVRTAVTRATDLRSLAVRRSTLRDRMRASPLCDARSFARNLGDALMTAFKDHVSGLCPPADHAS